MKLRPPTLEQNNQFYDRVARKEALAGQLLGKDSRFNADKALASPSIDRHFRQRVAPLIRSTDRVLDVGCGAGTFLPILAAQCDTLVGVDASIEFVNASLDILKQHRLDNTTVQAAIAEKLPFDDDAFDVVVATDVLHHIYELERAVGELHRVLKPGGRLIVFEPNILNPALLALCVLDRNEWGALGLCRMGAYRRMLRALFHINVMDHSGLLIGPDHAATRAIASLLLSRRLKRWVGWLSPKIFIDASAVKLPAVAAADPPLRTAA